MFHRTTAVLAAIGVVLIGTGLALGLAPSDTLDTHSAYPSKTTRVLDCGSPWMTDYGRAAEHAFVLSPAEAAQRCDDAHGTRGGLGLLLLGLGLATLLALGLTTLIRHAIAEGGKALRGGGPEDPRGSVPPTSARPTPNKEA